MIANPNWWYAAGVRALKTAAEVGVVLMGSDMLSIMQFDWKYIIGAMLSGAVTSMLISIKGLPEVVVEDDDLD